MISNNKLVEEDLAICSRHNQDWIGWKEKKSVNFADYADFTEVFHEFIVPYSQKRIGCGRQNERVVDRQLDEIDFFATLELGEFSENLSSFL